MKPLCEKTQAELGEQDIKECISRKDIQDHLVECQECFEFLEALRELNTSLSAMSQIDAPQDLVERVLEKVRLEQEAKAESHAGQQRKRGWKAEGWEKMARLRPRSFQIELPEWIQEIRIPRVSFRVLSGVATVVVCVLVVAMSSLFRNQAKLSYSRIGASLDVKTRIVSGTYASAPEEVLVTGDASQTADSAGKSEATAPKSTFDSKPSSPDGRVYMADPRTGRQDQWELREKTWKPAEAPQKAEKRLQDGVSIGSGQAISTKSPLSQPAANEKARAGKIGARLSETTQPSVVAAVGGNAENLPEQERELTQGKDEPSQAPLRYESAKEGISGPQHAAIIKSSDDFNLPRTNLELKNEEEKFARRGGELVATRDQEGEQSGEKVGQETFKDEINWAIKDHDTLIRRLSQTKDAEEDGHDADSRANEAELARAGANVLGNHRGTITITSGITFPAIAPKVEVDRPMVLDEISDRSDSLSTLDKRDPAKNLTSTPSLVLSSLDLDLVESLKKDSISKEKAKLAHRQGQITRELTETKNKRISPRLSTPPMPSPISQASDLARAFLQNRASLEALRFQEPSGYWANTYIPGDPEFRLLRSKLLSWDRTQLTAYISQPPLLDEGAKEPAQPFDAPTNSALAVYLNADKKGISEPSRMLLQVGLQATSQLSGNRPAMNVGIVLDARGELSVDIQPQIQALLKAFQEAKDITDRFSLTIAGKNEEIVVTPENFKHGYLTVTLQNLFRNDSSVSNASLAHAFETAVKTVTGSDDPNSPLGTSAIILITSQPLGEEGFQLEEMAHRSAVDGISVSTVGIGSGVDLEELNRIALAGQGNRRFLSTAQEAQELVAQEIWAASRVVARALRLRIRLAPGVKLIDVIGSKNLNEIAAQKVRKLEQSVDQRIARNLGIEADRGEDEEGIQIVIPAFYAGDSHVILLDVVAPGPGPIADVTARYKDLIYLRNGVSRANLSLENKASAFGVLEGNVFKNLLVSTLSTTLKEAGSALAQGAPAPGVMPLLRDHKLLLEGLINEVPGLARDIDIANDITMLDEYLNLLQTSIIAQEEQLDFIADSMRSAGFAKVLPRPVSERPMRK